MNESNQIITQTPLWKRIWLSLVALFAIGFGIVVLSIALEENSNSLRILVIYIFSLIFFAAISFVIIRLISWVANGLGEKKVGTFTKVIIGQIIAVIFLLIIYYVASPYQNCIRQNSYKNFCIKETSW